MDQWLREVIAVTPQCLQPPTADRTDGVSPLDLKSFGGPLLVLAAGKSMGEEGFLVVREDIRSPATPCRHKYLYLVPDEGYVVQRQMYSWCFFLNNKCPTAAVQ